MTATELGGALAVKSLFQKRQRATKETALSLRTVHGTAFEKGTTNMAEITRLLLRVYIALWILVVLGGLIFLHVYRIHNPRPMPL